MTNEEAINVINNADLSKVEDRVIKAIFYLCTNKALEQEPCEDTISRKDIYFKLTNGAYPNETIEQFIDRLVKELEALPSVTPQPKTGRWIKSTGYDNRDHFYTCSECGRNINLICGAKLADYPYCHCGAKMEEVSRMTLNESIKHAEEVAEGYKKKLKVYENIDEDKPLFTEEEMKCRLCAEEHRQLAEWLKELKQLRERTRWTSVSEGLPEDSGDYIVWIKPDGEKPYVSVEDIDCDGMIKKWNTIYAYGIVAWMPLPESYKGRK